MDYGSHQKHADDIIKRCRSRQDPNEIAHLDAESGKAFTYAQLADEIERMTDVGRATIAMAGLLDELMCTGCGLSWAESAPRKECATYGTAGHDFARILESSVRRDQTK